MNVASLIDTTSSFTLIFFVTTVYSLSYVKPDTDNVTVLLSLESVAPLIFAPSIEKFSAETASTAVLNVTSTVVLLIALTLLTAGVTPTT